MEAAGILTCAFGLGYVLQSAQSALAACIPRPVRSLLRLDQRLFLSLHLATLSFWATISFASLLLINVTACVTTVVLLTSLDQGARTCALAFASWATRDDMHKRTEKVLLLGAVGVRAALGAVVVGFTQHTFMPVCFPTPRLINEHTETWPGVAAACGDFLWLLGCGYRAWKREEQRQRTGRAGLMVVLASMAAWAAANIPFSVLGGRSTVFVRLIPTILTAIVMLTFIRMFPTEVFGRSRNSEDSTTALRRLPSYASEFPRSTVDLESIKHPNLYVHNSAHARNGSTTNSALFRNIMGGPIMHPGTKQPWGLEAAQKESMLLGHENSAMVETRFPSSAGGKPNISGPILKNGGFGPTGDMPGGNNNIPYENLRTVSLRAAARQQQQQRNQIVSQPMSEPTVSSPSTIHSFAGIAGMSMISNSTMRMPLPSASTQRPSVSAVKPRKQPYGTNDRSTNAGTVSPVSETSLTRDVMAVADDYRYSSFTFSTEDDDMHRRTARSSSAAYPLGAPPRAMTQAVPRGDDDPQVLLVNQIVYDNPALVHSLTSQSHSTSRYTRSAAGVLRRSPSGTAKRPPLSPPREAEEPPLPWEEEEEGVSSTPVIERRRSIKRQSLRVLFPRESRRPQEKQKRSKSIRMATLAPPPRAPLGSPPPPPTEPLPLPPVPKTPPQYAPKTPPHPSHPLPPTRDPPSPTPTENPLTAVSESSEKHLSLESIGSASTEIEEAYEIARTWVASVSTAARPAAGAGPVLVSIRHSRHGSSSSTLQALREFRGPEDPADPKASHNRQSSVVSNADSGVFSDSTSTVQKRAALEVTRRTSTDSTEFPESTVLMLSRKNSESLITGTVVELNKAKIDAEDHISKTGENLNDSRHSPGADSEESPSPLGPYFYHVSDDDADDEDHFSDDGADSCVTDGDPSDAEDAIFSDLSLEGARMEATERRLSARIRELTDAIPPPIPPIPARHFQLGDSIPTFHGSRWDKYGSKRKPPPPALGLVHHTRRLRPPPKFQDQPPVVPAQARRVSMQRGLQARLSVMVNNHNAARPLEELMHKLPTTAQRSSIASSIRRSSLLNQLEAEMGQQVTQWMRNRQTIMQRDSIASSLSSRESIDMSKLERMSQRRLLIARLNLGVERRLSISTAATTAVDTATTETTDTATTTATTTATGGIQAWQNQIAEAQMAYARQMPELDVKLRGWNWPESPKDAAAIRDFDMDAVSPVTPLPATVFGGEQVLSPDEIEEVKNSLESEQEPAFSKIRRSGIASRIRYPDNPDRFTFRANSEVPCLWVPRTDSPKAAPGGYLWNAGAPVRSISTAAAIATRPRKRFDSQEPSITSRNMWARPRGPLSAVERGLWRNPKDFRPKSIMLRGRAPSFKRVTFVEEVITVEPTGILGRLKKLWNANPSTHSSMTGRMVPIPVPPVPRKSEAERVVDVTKVLNGITQSYKNKALPNIPAPATAIPMADFKFPPRKAAVSTSPPFAGRLWKRETMTAAGVPTMLWPAARALDGAADVSMYSTPAGRSLKKSASCTVTLPRITSRTLWSPPTASPSSTTCGLWCQSTTSAVRHSTSYGLWSTPAHKVSAAPAAPAEPLWRLCPSQPRPTPRCPLTLDLTAAHSSKSRRPLPLSLTASPVTGSLWCPDKSDDWNKEVASPLKTDAGAEEAEIVSARMALWSRAARITVPVAGASGAAHLLLDKAAGASEVEGGTGSSANPASHQPKQDSGAAPTRSRRLNSPPPSPAAGEGLKAASPPGLPLLSPTSHPSSSLTPETASSTSLAQPSPLNQNTSSGLWCLSTGTIQERAVLEIDAGSGTGLWGSAPLVNPAALFSAVYSPPLTKRSHSSAPRATSTTSVTEPRTMEGSLWQHSAPSFSTSGTTTPQSQLWTRPVEPEKKNELWTAESETQTCTAAEIAAGENEESYKEENETSEKLWCSDACSGAPSVFAALPLMSARSKLETSTKTLPEVSEEPWMKRVTETTPRDADDKLALWTYCRANSTPTPTPPTPSTSSNATDTTMDNSPPTMWAKDTTAADIFAQLSTETLRSKKDTSTITLPVFSEPLWRKRVQLPVRPRLWVREVKPTGVWDAQGRTRDLKDIRPAKKQRLLWSESTASRTTTAVPERTRCAFRPTAEPLPVVGGTMWKKPVPAAEKELWKRPIRTVASTSLSPPAPLWAKETARRTTTKQPERPAVKKFIPSTISPAVATGSLWRPKAASDSQALWKRPLQTVAASAATPPTHPLPLDKPTQLWNRNRSSSRTTTAQPIRTTVQKRVVHAPVVPVSGSLWQRPAPKVTTGLWKRSAPPPITRPRRSSSLWEHGEGSRHTDALPTRSAPLPFRADQRPVRPAVGTLWTAPAVPTVKATDSEQEEARSLRLWSPTRGFGSVSEQVITDSPPPASPTLSTASTLTDVSEQLPPLSEAPPASHTPEPRIAHSHSQQSSMSSVSSLLWEPQRPEILTPDAGKVEIVTPLWPAARPAPALRDVAGGLRVSVPAKEKAELPVYDRSTHSLWVPEGGSGGAAGAGKPGTITPSRTPVLGQFRRDDYRIHVPQQQESEEAAENANPFAEKLRVGSLRRHLRPATERVEGL